MPSARPMKICCVRVGPPRGRAVAGAAGDIGGFYPMPQRPPGHMAPGHEPAGLGKGPPGRCGKLIYMGAHTIRRTADTRALLDSVRRIARTLHESSRAAEKQVGVTGAQLFVLQKLAESPAASLSDLAARTHTHESSVSTVVSRLVARGLV